VKKVTSLSLILLSILLSEAQQPDGAGVVKDWAISSDAFYDSVFAPKIQLVDSIREFARKELKLRIKDDFYFHWSGKQDSMYVFLYVSSKDSIKTPRDLPQTLWSFDTEAAAIKRSEELRKQNYAVLVYKTAGLSNALLNRKLLSYPNEAIAFILFHEATHNHHCGVTYVYEEALADAMANRACRLFAEKTHMLDIRAVAKQQKIFEAAYAFLNEKRKVLERIEPGQKAKVFRRCDKEIKMLVKHANQFQKDRMSYEVSNAYFLRVEAYALHYFEMKEQLESGKDLDKIAADMQRPHQPDLPEPPSLQIDSASSHFQWFSK
jgi:hypothetical protein